VKVDLFLSPVITISPMVFCSIPGFVLGLCS